MVVLKTGPMGAMRAKEERWRVVVFKEHLSGEERLSYGVVRTGNTSHCSVMGGE